MFKSSFRRNSILIFITGLSLAVIAAYISKGSTSNDQMNDISAKEACAMISRGYKDIENEKERYAVYGCVEYGYLKTIDGALTVVSDKDKIEKNSMGATLESHNIWYVTDRHGSGLPDEDQFQEVGLNLFNTADGRIDWVLVGYHPGECGVKDYKHLMNIELPTSLQQDENVVLKWNLPKEIRLDDGCLDILAAGDNISNQFHKSGEDQQYVDALTIEAEKGDASAQVKLGRMFHEGILLPQDLSKAIGWYTKAAEQGDVFAQFGLGSIYETENADIQNYPLALKWYKQAATQGSVGAQNGVLRLFELKQATLQDQREAISQLSKAADRGDMDAQIILGGMYYLGRGVDRDNNKAFSLLKNGAEDGDADAQTIIGIIYKDDDFSLKDDVMAFSFLKKAAKQGQPAAQYHLSSMYSRGKGTEQDLNKGIYLLNESAVQGYEEATDGMNRFKILLEEWESSDDPIRLNNVGFIYVSVLKDQKKFEKAFELFSTAAKMGNPYAQSNLAQMYVRGYGTPQDFSKAAEWFQKAAEQGNAEAQYRLSILYYSGEGVVQSIKNSLMWLEKAANQDYPPALFDLSAMYRRGDNVSQDIAKADELFNRAQNYLDPESSLSHLGEPLPKSAYSEYAHIFSNCEGLYNASSEFIPRIYPDELSYVDRFKELSNESFKAALIAHHNAFEQGMQTSPEYMVERTSGTKRYWADILDKSGIQDTDYKSRLRACQELEPIRKSLLEEFESFVEKMKENGLLVDEVANGED